MERATSCCKRPKHRNSSGAETWKRKRSDHHGRDSRKSQKQQASCSISRGNAAHVVDDSITLVEERIGYLNEEEAAISLSKGSRARRAGRKECRQNREPGEKERDNRRLTAFSVHEIHGEMQPIDKLEESRLYISALILPLEDGDDEEKETRIRCEGFGPIKSWSLSGYDENSPIIWLSTDAADYECLKPAKAYQKQYDLFIQKTSACIDVYRILSTCYGGNPNIGLDELVKKASHFLRERFPSEASTEDLIISWGRFIHRQLEGLEMDETSGEDTIFENLPVLLALRDASDNAAGSVSTRRRLRRAQGEYDIPDDYPPPRYYEKSINEMDECNVVKEDSGDDDDDDDDDDDYPQYCLENWCLYGLDCRFVPLEILPAKPSKDLHICCSGVMETDEGSSQSNGEGITVSLSEIREWSIQWTSSMVSVSIRTDIAWYALGNPLPEYDPWYQPVVKIVTLVVSIITLLKEQRRASMLQFKEVVEKVSGFSGRHASHISTDSSAVERYILIHGQFILQLFEIHPDLSIRKCAFVKSLGEHLKDWNQSNVVRRKASRRRREVVLNQEEAAVQEVELMSATTTSLVSRIWDDFREDPSCEGLDEDLEVFPSSRRWRKSPSADTLVKWEGKQGERLSSGKILYKQANVNGDSVHAGSSVILEIVDPKANRAIYYIEYLFADSCGRKLAHGRLMLRGNQTIIGHPSNERELFLTNHCIDFDLCHVKGIAPVEIRSNPWRHHQRKSNAEKVSHDKADAEERKRKGLPMEFFCRKLYCPEKGAFLCVKDDSIGIGNGHCDSCKLKESHNTPFFKLDMFNFTFKGIRYHVRDFIYIDPQYGTFGDVNQRNVKSEKCASLKPFVICQILGFEREEESFESPDPSSTILRLRRFLRPEDISEDKAHHSDIREIYYSRQEISLPVVEVKGKCELRKREEMHHLPTTYVYEHAFFCEKSYDHQTGVLKKLSPRVKRSLSGKQSVKFGRVKRKRLGKQNNKELVVDGAQMGTLRTLDIFAGCGGLSVGFERSGVSSTKWAIEYEKPIGEAFKLNHPGAKVFVRNCNVILRAIMAACGDADDCISTPEAVDLAAELDQKEIDDLPRPGEVDFILGGPPCQGFSGMNRFKEGEWSQRQCKMILAFLSFAEYFRPKFFLLENVRNFITYKKGQIFRFTIATLLEMGYQVRFGVLEAGAFGISQNRKRVFIWAASPEENLPDWPEPMYAFRGADLKIQLGDNIQYAAVPSTERGAPFRTITIRDAIGDLPHVENGASEPTLEYENKPVSWFQRQIRGEMQYLTHHICKNMDELNFLRCQGVPKRPGADWHDLANIKVTLSNGTEHDLLPEWLQNSTGKNNHWNGLYGRLDWGGKFPTCVTHPQPMGKVGRWIHPQQDRLISVREYARAQGFPDSYEFAGSVRDKHKQIGNAVPPPLAFALGKKLKEAIEKKHSNSPK